MARFLKAIDETIQRTLRALSEPALADDDVQESVFKSDTSPPISPDLIAKVHGLSKALKILHGDNITPYTMDPAWLQIMMRILPEEDRSPLLDLWTHALDVTADNTFYQEVILFLKSKIILDQTASLSRVLRKFSLLKPPKMTVTGAAVLVAALLEMQEVDHSRVRVILDEAHDLPPFFAHMDIENYLLTNCSTVDCQSEKIKKGMHFPPAQAHAIQDRCFQGAASSPL